MNVELLRRVQTHIIEHGGFSMTDCDDCVVGLAVRLATGRFASDWVLNMERLYAEGKGCARAGLILPVIGRQSLQLTAAQFDRLFHLEQWPPQFKEGDVVARIEHFITTGGAE